MQQPAGFDLPQGVQQLLGPAHGKGGDHYVAAPIQRPLKEGGKIRNHVDAFGGLMESIPVGGFDDQIIRIGHVLRVPDDGLIRVPHVAAEDDLLSSFTLPHPNLDAGRAQQVPNVGEPDIDRVVHRDGIPVAAGAEEGHEPVDVLRGVEGLYVRLRHSASDSWMWAESSSMMLHRLQVADVA